MWKSVAFILMGVLACQSLASAQTLPAKQQSTNQQEEDLLPRMKEIVTGLRVVRKADDVAVPVIDRALFIHTSPARAYPVGSTWAWGVSGRPLAFVKVFSRNPQNTRWTFCCALTSTEPIRMYYDDVKTWYPESPTIEFKPFPSAPRPANTESLRMRQMKHLAQLFRGHEFWRPGNSRYELHVKVQPVHRYRDAQRGVIDGAVFVVAHEVEPEILLLVEAKEKADQYWQYGTIAIGSAEFHLKLNGEEVYTRSRASNGYVGLPTDTYHAFSRDFTDG